MFYAFKYFVKVHWLFNHLVIKYFYSIVQQIKKKKISLDNDRYKISLVCDPRIIRGGLPFWRNDLPNRECKNLNDLRCKT